MKTYLTLPLLSLTTLALTQCVVDQYGNIPGTYGDNSAVSSSSGPRNFGQPLTVSRNSGSVTIREGGSIVSIITTASPNIEQTRWHREQEQIVVKSRGNHGPATVQLFNSRSGRELGRVMAYDIASGGPAWAAGMGE